VNNVPTPDLSAFLTEINKTKDRTSIRMNIRTLNDLPQLVTIKNDGYYFPTVEWIKDPNAEIGWKRTIHSFHEEGCGERQ